MYQNFIHFLTEKCPISHLYTGLFINSSIHRDENYSLLKYNK